MVLRGGEVISHTEPNAKNRSITSMVGETPSVENHRLAKVLQDVVWCIVIWLSDREVLVKKFVVWTLIYLMRHNARIGRR